MPLSLSLQQTQAITKLSSALYDFLPGTSHPYSKIKVDFGTIASQLGLANFWPGGSKRPALEYLISNTLENHRDKFCSLMVKITNEGLKYRNKKGNPVTQEEITQINSLIETLEFKIPELHDKNFISSLPSKNETNKENNKNLSVDPQKLTLLRNCFFELNKMEPQSRGYAFEKFLYELFDAYNFNPKPSFRNQGEQIDGSLEINHEVYLIEARWQQREITQSDLIVLDGRVSGHSPIGRGIYFTTGCFSKDGISAYEKLRGRAPMIGIDGQDLFLMLDEYLAFDEVIKKKIRCLVESGEFHYPVELFKTTIKRY